MRVNVSTWAPSSGRRTESYSEKFSVSDFQLSGALAQRTHHPQEGLEGWYGAV